MSNTTMSASNQLRSFDSVESFRKEARALGRRFRRATEALPATPGQQGRVRGTTHKAAADYFARRFEEVSSCHS